MERKIEEIRARAESRNKIKEEEEEEGLGFFVPGLQTKGEERRESKTRTKKEATE